MSIIPSVSPVPDSTVTLYPQMTDSILHASVSDVIPPEGMAGDPVPYLVRSENAVTLLLIFCLFSLCYALKDGKKYIVQYLKDLFRHKERASLFDEASKPNGRYLFLLITVTCVLGGIFLYDFLIGSHPALSEERFRLPVLAISIGIPLIYVMAKQGAYAFINWIFFDKEQNKSWMQTYLGLVGMLCFLLFPLFLLTVYSGLDKQISFYFILLILVFAKILLFYKSIRNFFNHFYGILHLILYFCALEIIPILLTWKGIVYINNIFI